MSAALHVAKHIVTEIRALSPSVGQTSDGDVRERADWPFGYQETFDAIAAATRVQGAAICISVEAFRNALRTPHKVQERTCTCHPDDKPPYPCPQKYALSECRAAATPDKVQARPGGESPTWDEIGALEGALTAERERAEIVKRYSEILTKELRITRTERDIACERVEKVERERDEAREIVNHGQTSLAIRGDNLQFALSECRRQRDFLGSELTRVNGLVERMTKALKAVDEIIFNDPQIIECAGRVRNIILAALSSSAPAKTEGK